MNVKIVRKPEQQPSKWSGGTTTQLAIFPETASYTKKDFMFRISTAKVETEKSEFTSLPGVSRIIMILDGTMKLNHKGRYSKTLQKFDTDTFDGSWQTTSFGKVTDFNLMTTNQATGKLFSRILQANKTLEESFLTHFDFVGFYLLCGFIEVDYNNKKFLIGKGDFILINHQSDFGRIFLTTYEYSEIIIPGIRLLNNVTYTKSNFTSQEKTV
jgi:environmental stress-induced protein Ves